MAYNHPNNKPDSGPPISDVDMLQAMDQMRPDAKGVPARSEVAKLTSTIEALIAKRDLHSDKIKEINKGIQAAAYERQRICNHKCLDGKSALITDEKTQRPVCILCETFRDLPAT